MSRLALFPEDAMGRCLSLFGMMFFTVGMVALASLAKGAPREPARPEETITPAREYVRQPLIAAASFHAPYSLN